MNRSTPGLPLKSPLFLSSWGSVFLAWTLPSSFPDEGIKFLLCHSETGFCFFFPDICNSGRRTRWEVTNPMATGNTVISACVSPSLVQLSWFWPPLTLLDLLLQPAKGFLHSFASKLHYQTPNHKRPLTFWQISLWNEKLVVPLCHLNPPTAFRCPQNRVQTSKVGTWAVGDLDPIYIFVSIGHLIRIWKGLPRWLSGKEPTCQCRRLGCYGMDS